MVGEEAGKQFGESDTGKKMQANPNYEDAKQIGKATLYAFVSVYDGLY
jgi:spartin